MHYISIEILGIYILKYELRSVNLHSVVKTLLFTFKKCFPCSSCQANMTQIFLRYKYNMKGFYGKEERNAQFHWFSIHIIFTFVSFFNVHDYV